MPRQRIYATLLFMGASLLFFRTMSMVAGDALVTLVPWVATLLLLEMAIDLVCMTAAVRWWITAQSSHDRLPLRLGTAAALLHALRVGIYVLGRTGRGVDFDIRQEFRTTEAATEELLWVWIAGILSILGVAGVIIIWRIRSGNRNREQAG